MKKWIKTTGIITVIAIVGVLAVGAVAFAQGPDAQNNVPPTNGWYRSGGPSAGLGNHPFENGRFGNKGMRPGRGPALEVLTGALGMSAEDLRAALAEGQTLPEIAEAQGVDWADVQTALVTAAEEQLTQAVADGQLTQERADSILEKLQNHDFSAAPPLPHNGMRGKRGGRGFAARPNLEALTETLGMSVEDLRAAWTEGQTLPEIAEAQGVTMADLAEAMYNSAVDRLQTAVDDGKLTQEQADTILQKLTDRYESCVNDGDCAPPRPHNRPFSAPPLRNQ